MTEPRRKRPRDPAQLAKFIVTRRQHEITALIAESLSNKEIARALKITQGTVKLHLHAIYSKLGVPNRTAFAALRAAVIAGQ